MYQDFMQPKRSWMMRTAGGQWLGFRRLARAFRGNVRVLLLTDVLWAFPCAWCFYYIPRYAEELGITPAKWGYLVALARLLQLVFAPVGGVLADKWGRKRTLVLIDSLAWTTPFVIYYFSRNQYHLFAGLTFISLWVVGMAAWECLFIESTPRRHLARIVSIRSVFFLLPGTTTFIAGFIVFVEVFRQERWRRRAMKALVAVTILSVACAWVQYFWPGTSVTQIRGAWFDNRNTFGAFLALVLPLLFGVSVLGRSWLRRVGFVVLAFAGL